MQTNISTHTLSNQQCTWMFNNGREDFYSFLPNISQSSQLSAENKLAEITTVQDNSQVKHNISIRSRITQSTSKITKEAAEGTNKSCSLKMLFNRVSQWIEERMCYYLLSEHIIKSQVQKTHWEALHIQNYSTSSHNVYYRGAQLDKGEILSQTLHVPQTQSYFKVID